MDQIAIVPLSNPTAKPIKILEEKTVIGRGPFLQVTDKRVSRSHAVLEVQDGKLYLTPTHTNPCFFKKTSKAAVEIMKKDEKRLMYNNQIFGLLPDSLFFQVTCPAVQNGTEEGSEKEETDEEASGSESEEEEEPKEKPKPQKLKHQPSIGRKSLEGRDLLMPLDKKRVLPNWLTQIAKQPPPGANPIAPPIKRPVAVSPPKPQKPKTPSRPKKTESEEDEDFDVKEERRRQYNTPAKKPKKKYKEESEEDWEAEEEYSPKKSTSRRGGSAVKPRKKARESSEEDWDSGESPKKKKRKEKKKEKKKHQVIKVGRRRRHSSEEDGPSTSRPSRTARTKKASYAEDFVLPDEFSDEDDLPVGSLSKEEDSDFVMDDGDESGSDWEASQRSKGKGKSSKGTPKRTPKRGGKKRYADSEEDISEEDEYVPRSSKKRQGSSAKKGRKKKQESSDEEEESEPEYKPKARGVGRGSAKKGKKQKDLSASEEETKELENGLKNKWRWQWLQEKDVEGKAWDEWCKKPKIAGSCFCVPCGKTISYSSNGKKALRLHGEDPNHKKNVKIVKTNQLLPGVSGQGHASVLDRCAELRAITSAFISENCLPFSLADRLVGYARRMGKDKHALEKVSISRTSATYVATHGVAKSLKDDLKEKLKDSYFSLNVDEATNNSNNKILNVLVQYFDTEQQRIVIDHLGSRQQNLATAKNLFNDIADVLKSYDLKWEQVISILMDNCSTMRGVRGGVETLCREENQHLLDISGDTVHMMNNIAKALLSEMDSSIPNLCDDLYYDIEESPKVQKIFTEVQTLTNIKFHSKNATQAMHLIRPISSRFLQLLAVITRVVALFSALTVYYYSFLTEEEKKAHSSTLQQIYRENKVSEGEQARISLIQLSQEQQAKSVTSNARKDRIISALFEHRVELMVKLNLYRGLLSVFEGYIKSFQAEKPLMHILLVNMLNVTTEILGMFILPEEIPDKVKDIVALDVTDRNIQKSDTELAVGKYAYLDLKKAQKNKASHYWLQPLYSSLRAGYVKAAIKLLKLPLANKTLRRLSSLDPTLAKHSSTPRALKALGGSLPNVIVEEEQGQLAMEASTYSTDQNVSALAADFTEAGRIDTDYWTKVFKLEWQGKPKYPVLTKLVCALLSIFSGPLVESSFNIMDDIIEKDRSALTVENYEAVATIKTTLKRKNTRAEDMVVNLKMKKSCINAYQTYQKHLKQKKEAKEEKQRQVLAASVIQLRKEKAKRISKLIKLQKLRRQEMAGVKRKSLVEPGKPRKIQKYKRIKLVD